MSEATPWAGAGLNERERAGSSALSALTEDARCLGRIFCLKTINKHQLGQSGCQSGGGVGLSPHKGSAGQRRCYLAAM